MKAIGYAVAQIHERHRTILDVGRVENGEVAAVLACAIDHGQQPAVAFGGILAFNRAVDVEKPGVIISGEFSGDRADLRCAARWASGHWAREVARRLDTHSKYDVPLRSGVFMRVAAFDHSQIRHTRRVRPIRLEVD